VRCGEGDFLKVENEHIEKRETALPLFISLSVSTLLWGRREL